MAAVRLESPILRKGRARWLKGSLHTHTTRSDGKSDPQVMVRAYAKLGHDFLMLSDHDTFSDGRGLKPCGMVLLPGNEVCGGGSHLLDVGARALVRPYANRQRTIDAVNRRSGFVILCHPNWTENFNHYPYETLRDLTGYAGVEIFNGVVWDLPGSHLALDKWDRLLAAGRVVWGYANDDAHRLEQVGRGWNVVRARARTRRAILDALRRGAFYASSGVTIRTIEAKGPVLRVVAPDADLISVYAPYGAKIFSAKGPELRFDASDVMAPFIRVECIGRGGRTAWTQPIFIRGGRLEASRRRLAKLEMRRRPTLRALRATRPPELTGRLDDPLWNKAPAASDFMRMKDGAKPGVKTEVRAIVTATHLYLGARCEEPALSHMRLRATREKNNSVWADDCVEFFLDVTGAAEEYAHVQVNANGVVSASWHSSARDFTRAVKSKAGRTRKGWTVEVAIPLKTLRGKTRKGKRWGFHLCRNRAGAGETYVWSWVGTTNHTPERFGKLVF